MRSYEGDENSGKELFSMLQSNDTVYGTGIFDNPNYGSPLNPYADGEEPDYLKLILTSKVYEAAIESPLQKGVNLSMKSQNNVLLKREDSQAVFSFKLRGAYNKLAHMSPEQREKGVLACSAGNHAQGVALAAQKMSIPATIVMPECAPALKVKNVQRLGASVILSGEDFQAAQQECMRMNQVTGLPVIPPYDDPLVIAGQGTIAMEILRQYDYSKIDAIFVCVGGGGLIAGISSYVKRIRPEIKVIGVEAYDACALQKSLEAGVRVELDEVGLFADGAAVRLVGKETFRLARSFVDEVVLVSTDEICAAIKDVFEDTRSVMEPAGALSIAGLKKYVAAKGWTNKTVVGICSGANMNFDRLRFVAERAELGEGTEALISIVIPERPNAFLQLYKSIEPSVVTEFSYRYGDDDRAQIIASITVENRQNDLAAIFSRLRENGMTPKDCSDNEMAKSHGRHLVGGRKQVPHERLFRFTFPETRAALGRFLLALNPQWNISLFHYRNYGGDVGKVMTGIQVPPETNEAFEKFLSELKYPFVEETSNEIYRLFLT